MCGRFVLKSSGVDLAEQFSLASVPNLVPSYNIAPTQNIAVIRQNGESRTLDMLRWGLIPSWAKDPAIGTRMINARSETVVEKPAFRRAFASRRCLVPVDGFYEWQRSGRQKQPFYFSMRDGRPFAVAGLWEQWHDADGSTLETCTLLTTSANEITEPIHHRMPVILHPDDYALWLNPATRSHEPLLSLLEPYPSEEMQAYPVSNLVNNVRNDDARCIEPMDTSPGLLL